jgi:hypothetical protein
MWIFSEAGFFSIVQKGGRTGTPMVIRARVRDDLENLQEMFHFLGPVETEEGTDYPYRIYASKHEVSQVMSVLVNGIDYSNFKDRVAATAGKARASLYGKVWGVMYGAESKV